MAYKIPIHIKMLMNFWYALFIRCWRIVFRGRSHDGKELHNNGNSLDKEAMMRGKRVAMTRFRVSRRWWCCHLATTGLGKLKRIRTLTLQWGSLWHDFLLTFWWFFCQNKEKDWFEVCVHCLINSWTFPTIIVVGLN
jgi:hypothetical protein